MPELPEVETTLRAIEKFKNQRLSNIKVHNRNLRWKVDKDLEINSKNQIIKNLRRRAKYIIFDLDKCSIILHLGMSGSLRLANNDDNYFLKHDHVEFLFENEKIFYSWFLAILFVIQCMTFKRLWLTLYIYFDPKDGNIYYKHQFNVI